VTISGEIVIERISSAYGAKAKSWRPQIIKDGREGETVVTLWLIIQGRDWYRQGYDMSQSWRGKKWNSIWTAIQGC